MKRIYDQPKQNLNRKRHKNNLKKSKKEKDNGLKKR